MKYKDKQIGGLYVLYKDTKANIEALSNVEAGATAFANDTGEMGVYSGTNWVWASGDMLKSTYDIDNNGIVDNAEKLSGIEATVTPTADKIPIANSSGNLDDWVTASKAYISLQQDGKIGMSGSQLVTANDIRINYNNIYSITEDFTSTTPSGWTWAGSPFVTPSVVQSIKSTWIRMNGMSGGERSFFYKTYIADQILFAMLPAINTNSGGMYTGIRFDDGSDNTYMEVVLWYSSSGTPFRIYYISRINGGAVTKTEVTNLAQTMFDGWLIHVIFGTRWSNWHSNAILTSMNGTWLRSNMDGPTMTFTPARVGIVIKFGGYTWQSVGVDAVNF